MESVQLLDGYEEWVMDVSQKFKGQPGVIEVSGGDLQLASPGTGFPPAFAAQSNLKAISRQPDTSECQIIQTLVCASVCQPPSCGAALPGVFSSSVVASSASDL